MPRTIHELKVHHAYFPAIRGKHKTFEIRKNDRGYQTGDILILKEYDPVTATYTGRDEVFQVGFMLQGQFGLPEDVCCMSLVPFLYEWDAEFNNK